LKQVNFVWCGDKTVQSPKFFACFYPFLTIEGSIRVNYPSIVQRNV